MNSRTVRALRPDRLKQAIKQTNKPKNLLSLESTTEAKLAYPSRNLAFPEVSGMVGKSTQIKTSELIVTQVKLNCRGARLFPMMTATMEGPTGQR